MKKLLLLVLALMFFIGCSTVPAGHKGIKVYLLGTNKGVDNEVLGVGRYWIGINEELYIYPIYQVNYVYTKDTNEGSPTNEEFTFQTVEGMDCAMDLGVAIKFDEAKIAAMFQTYRKGPDEIRGVVVRNSIRDALNKVGGTMPVEAVYGAGKAKLIESVESLVKSQLTPSGILIDKISLIGLVRIPPQIKEALDQKVAATQRAQQRENELREAEAAAAKDVAKAQGEAKANQIKMSSLSPNIIEWQRLQNEQLAIQKWNGALPTMMSGNTVPFINVNEMMKK